MDGIEHDWNVSPEQARAIQQELRTRVVQEDAFGSVRHIAGVDVGFEDQKRITRAAVVVLDAATLEPIESRVARLPTAFPYVPGLLSFREVPAILAALDELRTRPDLILCDGQGIAHPRRFGVACHLGVLTDIPCIGVAKSRLVGTHADPGPDKGTRTDLIDGEERIGVVLRSRDRVRPLYVSVGHRVGLDTAVEQVMNCLTRYRLPEPTRLADRIASRRG